MTSQSYILTIELSQPQFKNRDYSDVLVQGFDYVVMKSNLPVSSIKLEKIKNNEVNIK